MSKLALKALTAADLTFFEWHFRNRNAGNQKAINLNADVFVAELFPTLPEIAPQFDGRLPVDLYLYGPNMSAELNLQRKIIKHGTYKNWRLDGETIHNPGDAPERFDSLRERDIAVLEFNEGHFPSRVRMVFLAQVSVADAPLHSQLAKRLAAKSMVSLDQVDLLADIGVAKVAASHPVHALILEPDLEDAAEGGPVGAKRLRSRRGGRKVLRSELENAKKRAEETGRLGEEFINYLLLERLDKSEIGSLDWESADDAVSPYDFRVTTPTGQDTLIEVKSTTGEFQRMIHISLAELEQMADHDGYEIYRVYSMNETVARVRIATSLKGFAQRTLGTLANLPDGVLADAVSVKPEILKFGPEIALHLPQM